jgi:hypothetical protein
MPTTCLHCGQEWPRDPALEVACPTFHAAIGSRCKRPSGHEAGDAHAARDRLAMQTIPGYDMCPAVATATAHPPEQPRAASQQLALYF